MSITALKFTRRIPGAGVEAPLPVGPSPNGSESEPIWGLVSASASEAGSGGSAIEEEWVLVQVSIVIRVMGI